MARTKQRRTYDIPAFKVYKVKCLVSGNLDRMAYTSTPYVLWACLPTLSWKEEQRRTVSGLVDVCWLLTDTHRRYKLSCVRGRVASVS